MRRAVPLAAVLLLATAAAGQVRPYITYGEPARGAATDKGASPPSSPAGVGAQQRISDPIALTVGITFRDAAGESRICSGIVVSPSRVLTAGHCGCGVPRSYRISPTNRIGDLIRNAGPRNAAGIPLVEAPVLFDPGQCRRGYIPGKDLALLLMDGVLCGPGTTHLCTDGLFESFRDVAPEIIRRGKLIVVGFGLTETGSSGERRRADVQVRSADCGRRIPGSDCAPLAEMILSDRSGGGRPKDSCDGDSGGPVFLPVQDRMILVAITSRATPGFGQGGGGACGGGGIYEIIGRSSVRAWILVNTAHETREVYVGPRIRAVSGGQPPQTRTVPEN